MNMRSSGVIELKELGDERGLLTVIEEKKTVPFEVKRIFIFLKQYQMFVEDFMLIIKQDRH